jgi:ABC-type transport system involved in Fe-S cluster assembly fused permease/ATPase subunit
MRRREFILGLGTAVACPGVPQAQRAETPRIGYLTALPPDSQDHIRLQRSNSLASGPARLMSQDVQLFHDTIAADIAYGREGASPEDIRAAATIARADQFIEALPTGYETVVANQGVRLSGGERQRIALARTVLRDPDVLFLDEATNAFDVESEQAFQLALERYAHSLTHRRGDGPSFIHGAECR